MKLNKRLWKSSKIIEMILDDSEWHIDAQGNRIFISGIMLKKTACSKCPIKLECVTGDVVKSNPILDPHLLPNIESGPRIYCFSNIRGQK
jgi:hypothetical protein